MCLPESRGSGRIIEELDNYGTGERKALYSIKSEKKKGKSFEDVNSTNLGT